MWAGEWRGGGDDTVSGVRGCRLRKMENTCALSRETGGLFAKEQVLRSFLFPYIFFSNPKTFSDTRKQAAWNIAFQDKPGEAVVCGPSGRVLTWHA